MIKSRYYIELFDMAYDYTTRSKVYMPLPNSDINMEKALKKWYKHLRKAAMTYGYIDIYAGMECEDGSFSDLSLGWAYDEMEHDPEILF